ncbi:hypothetical protein OROHE_022550 [Orobanche hederae]
MEEKTKFATFVDNGVFNHGCFNNGGWTFKEGGWIYNIFFHPPGECRNHAYSFPLTSCRPQPRRIAFSQNPIFHITFSFPLVSQHEHLYRGDGWSSIFYEDLNRDRVSSWSGVCAYVCWTSHYQEFSIPWLHQSECVMRSQGLGQDG